MIPQTFIPVGTRVIFIEAVDWAGQVKGDTGSFADNWAPQDAYPWVKLDKPSHGLDYMFCTTFQIALEDEFLGPKKYDVVYQ